MTPFDPKAAAANYAQRINDLRAERFEARAEPGGGRRKDIALTEKIAGLQRVIRRLGWWSAQRWRRGVQEAGGGDQLMGSIALALAFGFLAPIILAGSV